MLTALLELEENTLFKPLRGRLKLLQTFEYHCSRLLFFMQHRHITMQSCSLLSYLQ